MIIKEEGTHRDPAMQTQLSSDVLARSEVTKQSLYSRGLSWILRGLEGDRRISRQWEKEAEEIISRIKG